MESLPLEECCADYRLHFTVRQEKERPRGHYGAPGSALQSHLHYNDMQRYEQSTDHTPNEVRHGKLQGKSNARAARDAGYSDSVANVAGQKISRRCK